jgi:predicted site-specific integrase-resolvase
MALPYPPPYQDVSTLAKHLCLHPDTVEVWVKMGRLPPPAIKGGGKRLWRWKDVEAALSGKMPHNVAQSDAERIRNATAQAIAEGR